MGDEIVVCGQAQQREKTRYRLSLPREELKGVPGREAVYEERNRWLDLGKSGTGSQTAIGPGGESGDNLARLKRAMDRNEGRNLLGGK